jgi:predicted PurR-regulated permease PerM
VVPSTRAIAKVILVAVGILVVLYLIYKVRSIVKLVLIATFLAVALGPAVEFLQRRSRIPRSLAILLV